MLKKDQKNIVGSVYLIGEDIKTLENRLVSLGINEESDVLKGQGNLKKVIIEMTPRAKEIFLQDLKSGKLRKLIRLQTITLT